mgnify:CR=1 FL=1
MSTTYQLDTATSRAHPTPAPLRRLSIPAIRQRKENGATADPVVMLTAYTARQAQLLDAGAGERQADQAAVRTRRNGTCAVR